MTPSVKSTFLLVVVAAWLGAGTPAANAVIFDVQFAGQVRESDDARDNSSTLPFDRFAVGTPFTGSFRFDSSLILQHVESTAISSGELDLYFSPVRDFHVVFDFGGGDTYRYDARPELTSDILDFDPGSGSTWRIGDNVEDLRDEVSLWVNNYPKAWVDGVTEEPAVPVPASEYVDGLYPHAAFWELADYGPKTMVASPDPIVDLNAAFANSTRPEFALRFTDPALPSWKTGLEAVVGVVYGDITSLTSVTVPEPAGATMIVFALAPGALANRVRRASA
jgi:hypothetical protein